MNYTSYTWLLLLPFTVHCMDDVLSPPKVRSLEYFGLSTAQRKESTISTEMLNQTLTAKVTESAINHLELRKAIEACYSHLAAIPEDEDEKHYVALSNLISQLEELCKHQWVNSEYLYTDTNTPFTLILNLYLITLDTSLDDATFFVVLNQLLRSPVSQKTLCGALYRLGNRPNYGLIIRTIRNRLQPSPILRALCVLLLEQERFSHHLKEFLSQFSQEELNALLEKTVTQESNNLANKLEACHSLMHAGAEATHFTINGEHPCVYLVGLATAVPTDEVYKNDALTTYLSQVLLTYEKRLASQTVMTLFEKLLLSHTDALKKHPFRSIVAELHQLLKQRHIKLSKRTKSKWNELAARSLISNLPSYQPEDPTKKKAFKQKVSKISSTISKDPLAAQKYFQQLYNELIRRKGKEDIFHYPLENQQKQELEEKFARQLLLLGAKQHR